jgi:hypothetical protein
MTIKLNAEQQTLIDVLKRNGGWLAQDDIAHDLGKTKLTPDELMQLDLLGDVGLLVKETSDNLSPAGEGVRYRFAEPKAEPRTHTPHDGG